MKQGQFERLYQEQWSNYQALLELLEAKNRSAFLRSPKGLRAMQEKRLSARGKGSSESGPNVEDFAHLYRKICHYHSLATERKYSSYLVDKLGDFVVRGHRQLYQQKRAFAYHFVQFFVRDFPVLVREQATFLWVASALLYLPALVLGVLIFFIPEVVYTVLDPVMVSNFEEMYNPDNRILGEAREADTNWYMFGYYINNNISVAFRTFASGILMGIGSVYFLFYNGLIFGGVAGHLVNAGFSETFFSFVVGHGSFELTAICIAGAAGLKLGYALLAPGNYSRLDALKREAKISIRLIYGVIAMLTIAAFIEAFWSSNNMLTPVVKFFVGAGLWLVVFCYLLWGGRRFGSE